jgi:phosphohistidine swiveling domain-containing protein
MKNPADLSFEAPGPGLWATDGLHTAKPITKLKFSTYLQMPSGMRVGMSRYGSLAEGMGIVVIHRFVYITMNWLVTRPPGNDEQAERTFQALVTANPEVQERFFRAEHTLATKRWRADTEHWDNIGKPWMMGRTLALTDKVPSRMSDEALGLHVEESLHHLGRSLDYHHLLNLVPALPRGLFFLKTMEWTGLNIADLQPLTIGSSPISAGDEPELRALVDAIDNNAGIIKDLESKDSAADIIEGLCQRDDAVGKSASDFIRMVGYRTVDGWEPMNPYILEAPELLLDKIKNGLSRQYASLDQSILKDVRARVPAAHHSEFDELFLDARKYARIKDERDLYCNIPASGILRRAVIEAGLRAADRGLINDPEHMTEASLAEILQLGSENRNDLAAELADRYLYRQTYSIDDVPPSLGEEGPMPAPPDWLPAASALMNRAMGINIQDNQPIDHQGSDEILLGRPVSPGTYEGIARLVQQPGEINEIMQGEVLVTRSTNPAFNVVLPRLGALVTEYGGVLSHAAIVAREFGLPGIVGCKAVTKKIRTGDRIRVDGGTGEVTVLSRESK